MSSNYTCSAPIQVRPPFQQVTPPLNAIFKDSTAELPLSGQLMAVDCSTCFHCNHNAHCLPPQFYIIILLFPISPGYYSYPKRNPRQWWCKIWGCKQGALWSQWKIKWSIEYLCILLALKLRQRHHFILKQTQDGCGLTGPESVVTNLKLCFPPSHF